MKNVYEQVHAFYEGDEQWRAPVSRDWVDGFLRHKAWQGNGDEELRLLWRQLELFFLYLMYIDNADLSKLEADDYQRAVAWLERHVNGFTASDKNIRNLFSALRQFYLYLASARKLPVSQEALDHAEVNLLRSSKNAPMSARIPRQDNRLSTSEMARLIRETGADSDIDPGRTIGRTAEQLMMAMGTFFQDQNYAEDLKRALFLYCGPESLPETEQDEDFWLGFWDYFLFDYHMLANDLTPLAYFDAMCGNTLTAEQRMLLTQLQAAQFTVFYMNKVSGQDWVECVNLFTEEKFQMPLPDFSVAAAKRSLFYGHIFSQEIVMVNYVTCVEVSAVLRRRIKEQVIKQKKIFEIQCPNATWGEFFQRHALAVRHSIDRLLNMATVNVTPFMLLDKEYPKIEGQAPVNDDVTAIITRVMREYSFSFHDIHLAQKLWSDFSQLFGPRVRKPALWAAIVIYSYAHANYPYGLPASRLADDLKITASSIYNGASKLRGILGLSEFDPRYLSEEGLVCSLFVN